MGSTLYTILDVPPDADQATIARAYAARISMADAEGTIDRATLTYAYLVLSDPDRRAAYDLALQRAAKQYEGGDSK